jgi:hypothetical protein
VKIAMIAHARPASPLGRRRAGKAEPVPVIALICRPSQGLLPQDHRFAGAGARRPWWER